MSKNDELFDISDEFTKSLEKLVEEETNVAKAYVKDNADKIIQTTEDVSDAVDVGSTQMFDSEEVKKSIAGVDIGDLLDDDYDDEFEYDDINIASSRKISSKDLPNNERVTARLEEKRMENRKNIIIIAVVATVVLIAVVGIILGAMAMSNKNKNSYEYNMEQAKGYYESGDYATALNFYKVAYGTTEGKKDVDLMYRMYLCYSNADDEIMAKDMLEDILAYDKYNEAAIKALGQYYVKTQNGSAINSLLATYRDTRAESYIQEFEVAVPTVSETPGTFSSPIKLSLMAGSGCTIYYTVDGSNPTKESTVYTGELQIGMDLTVKAMAVDRIGVESLVAEYKYAINLNVPDGPVLNVATGSTIDTDTVLKVTNLKAGTKVYYTIDGTTPTADSLAYENGIQLANGSCIVSLVTIDSNGEASKITRYTYVVNQVKIYTYEECVTLLKERMIGLNILQSDGLSTTGGDKVSFLYESKQDIDGKEMYIIKYVVNSATKSEGYYGVSTKGGNCYKVTVSNGKYSAVKY